MDLSLTLIVLTIVIAIVLANVWLFRGDYTTRLSTFDSLWLRCDHDPRNTVVITGLIRFDGQVEYEQLKLTFEARLLIHPRFLSYPIEKPFGPLRWKRDTSFDIKNHLPIHYLPDDVDQEEGITKLLNEIIAKPLEKTRPLWQIHIVYSKTSDCSFLIVRIHHCIADGMALVTLLLSLTNSTSLSPQITPNDNKTSTKSKTTSKSYLIQIYNVLWKYLFLRRDSKTSLKGSLSNEKVVRRSKAMDLNTLKTIGRNMDCTINDLLLAATSGALRRYVSKRGAPTQLHIRTVVPFNLRALKPAQLDQIDENTQVDLWNDFSLLYLDLPVAIDNPSERVHEMHRRMEQLKTGPEPIVNFIMMKSMGFLPAQLFHWLFNYYSKRASLIITNVPGPRQIRTLANRHVKDIMFWVPQTGNIGVGISIFSYTGKVSLGLFADQALIDDADEFIDLFHNEIQTLCADQPLFLSE